MHSKLHAQRNIASPIFGLLSRRTLVDTHAPTDIAAVTDKITIGTSHHNSAALSDQARTAETHLSAFQAPPDAAMRRALRTAAKHPIPLYAGPPQQVHMHDAGLTCGALTVIADPVEHVNSRAAYLRARSLFNHDPVTRSVLLQIESGIVGATSGWKTTVRVSTAADAQFTPLVNKHLHIDWNPAKAIMPSSGKALSPSLILAHEFFHAYHYAYDEVGYLKRSEFPAGFKHSREEALTMARERIASHAWGDGRRTEYFEAAFFTPNTINGASALADSAREAARLHAVRGPGPMHFPRSSHPQIQELLERRARQLPPDSRARALQKISENFEPESHDCPSVDGHLRLSE